MAFACGIASLFVCLCTLEEFRSGGEILAQCVFVQMSVANASGILGRFTTCPPRLMTDVLQTYVPIQLPTAILAQVSHPHSLTAHEHHVHHMRFRHCYYTRTLDPANLGLLLSPQSCLCIYGWFSPCPPSCFVTSSLRLLALVICNWSTGVHTCVG